MIPEFVTHYARGEPFRSVTAAGPAGWARVVAALTEDKVWGLQRYQDPEYLPRRAAVEAAMHEALLRAGGAPRIRHPHYGFLGRRPSWERPGTRAHDVAIADIPAGTVSFTVGDSLLTWDAEYRAMLEERDGPLHPLTGSLLGLGALNPELAPLVEVQLWWAPEPS